MGIIFLLTIITDSIKIRRGENLSQITAKLYAHKIIQHPFWFKVWAKVTGSERKIKAGYYEFKKPSSIRETLKTLVQGKSIEVKVTIPEGATLKEIKEILIKECDIDGEEFWLFTHNEEYVKKLGINSPSLEGYLYPNSYFFPYGVEVDVAIKKMVREFFNVFTDKLKERAKEIGFTMEEAVILASLIEEEAVYDYEKPIISGVYHNRLKKDILLQCDATIQYILPKRKPNLTYSDLKIDSKYNTYIYKGLPPTPICSPGKGAIISALYPVNTDYLYFVAKGDGTHEFSRTLKEHNLKKIKIKKERWGE